MTNYVVKATEIKYDIDEGEVVGPLPSEITFNIKDVDDIEELEDRVSDAISDKTGWCHLGFVMEIISES
jgi:hypothetical protein